MERHAWLAASSFPACSSASAVSGVGDCEIPCEGKKSERTSINIQPWTCGIRDTVRFTRNCNIGRARGFHLKNSGRGSKTQKLKHPKNKSPVRTVFCAHGGRSNNRGAGVRSRSCRQAARLLDQRQR